MAASVVECARGVADCALAEFGESCAAYDNHYPLPENMIWVVWLSAAFGILMAFGIGANDAANSWATTVGSGALSLQKACMIGGFMEFLGALTLGYGVSKTIQKGVAKIGDPDCWGCGTCHSDMSLYMAAMMAALVGASLFLIMASYTSVPVSTTHSIVGGVIGVTIVATKFGCLNWDMKGKGLGAIMLSWAISPLLSGLIASSLYLLSDRFVMKSKFPVQRSFKIVSFLFGLSGAVIVIMIFFKSKPLKKNVKKPLVFLIAFGIGSVISALTAFLVVPKLGDELPSKNPANRAAMKSIGGTTAKKISEIELQDTMQVSSNGRVGAKLDVLEEDNDSQDLEKPEKEQDAIVKLDLPEEAKFSKGEEMSEEQIDAIYVFRWLLVFNACLEAYGHGANDTANATGPFTAVLHTWRSGINDCSSIDTPWYVMGVAGLFVWLGIVSLGGNVIKTIGTKVAHIDFHKGFYIELGSNVSVIVATIMELPVSTTHCQIGGVLFVGIASAGAKKGVDWNLLGLIVLTWVLTLPMAGFMGGAVTALVKSVL